MRFMVRSVLVCIVQASRLLSPSVMILYEFNTLWTLPRSRRGKFVAGLYFSKTPARGVFPQQTSKFVLRNSEDFQGEA
jgi:hypothetical protein